jgi:hypothetical protein
MSTPKDGGGGADLEAGAPQDPYPQFRADVISGLKNADVLFILWKERNTSSAADAEDKFEMTKTELQKVLDDLDAGITTIEDVTRMASESKKIRRRFNIDEGELASRLSFAKDSRAKVRSIRNAVNNPDNEYRGSSRKELMNRPGGDRRNRIEEAIVEDNDRFVGEQREQIQMKIKEQDQALTQISLGVEKVGQMAEQINDTLHEQDKLITDLDQKADTFMAKLARVQGNLDKLLKSEDKGKICTIFALMIVLVVIASFAFYM